MDAGAFYYFAFRYTESPVNGKGNPGCIGFNFMIARPRVCIFKYIAEEDFIISEAEEKYESSCHIYVGGTACYDISCRGSMPEELSELIIASLLLGERLKLHAIKN